MLLHVSRVSIGPRATARLRVRCVLQHGQGIPGISIKSSRYYYYWDTAAVLQTCEHYRQDLPPQGRRIVLRFTGQVQFTSRLTAHTQLAGLRYCSQKPSTVSNTEIPNWHAVRQDAYNTVPRILGHAMPTQGHTRVWKREPRKKNRPRLRPIMENFTFPRPTGIHSATQAIGPRGPKDGARVVFRTEPFSDIPPFRGPSPASRPRSKGGASGHPPHRGKEARRWAPSICFENTSFLSAGWGRQDKV